MICLHREAQTHDGISGPKIRFVIKAEEVLKKVWWMGIDAGGPGKAKYTQIQLQLPSILCHADHQQKDVC